MKEELLREVTLELMVCDYDKLSASDHIGKVSIGYNRKGVELKHWKDMIENPRHGVIQWHVLKDWDLILERVLTMKRRNNQTSKTEPQKSNLKN